MKIKNVKNKVESILQVSTFINTSTAEIVKFVILRNDKKIELLVKPNLVLSKDSLGNSTKKRIIGIRLSISNDKLVKKPLNPSKAILVCNLLLFDTSNLAL